MAVTTTTTRSHNYWEPCLEILYNVLGIREELEKG